MICAGVIRRTVEWRESRRFFYWRLRRLIAEHSIAQLVRLAEPSFTVLQSRDYIRKCLLETGTTAVR